MCSLYTSIFSNLFQILVLCYLTLKCFQISNMLYISTYKLCVLALVFKNKKVKISKATPWFLKHDKGVIFFPPGSGVSVAGISQNFSLVPSQILNTAIASTVVYAPERQSSPFSKLATEIIPEALLKVSVVFTWEDISQSHKSRLQPHCISSLNSHSLQCLIICFQKHLVRHTTHLSNGNGLGSPRASS